MSTNRISKSFTARQSICLLALGLLTAAAPVGVAQTTSQSAMLTLPDAPDAVRSSNSVSSSSSASAGYFDPPPQQAKRQAEMAAPSDKYIAPDEQVPSLTARDKFVMGAKDSISPFSIAAWVTSAAWSHLTDSSPNYGTNSGAFGQRVGASVVRDISQELFSTSIMAVVLHEDPRYYKMGHGHSIGRRAVYAATRAFVTRTDSGRTTPNLSLFAGNLAGAALTNAYYPPRNHGFGQTMEIYAGSMGGSALGFVVSEFLSDTLEIVHLKKRD